MFQDLRYAARVLLRNKGWIFCTPNVGLQCLP